MRYLVSTITYDGAGQKIDAWEGDWIEACSEWDAIQQSTEHLVNLLEQEGAIDIEVDDREVHYEEEGDRFCVIFDVEPEEEVYTYAD